MLTARASAAFLPSVEVGQRARSVESRADAAVIVTGATRRLGLVVLVADVADQLLEQILERDEAQRVAASSSRTMARCSALAQHAEQQLVAGRVGSSRTPPAAARTASRRAP